MIQKITTNYLKINRSVAQNYILPDIVVVVDIGTVGVGLSGVGGTVI